MPELQVRPLACLEMRLVCGGTLTSRHANPVLQVLDKELAAEGSPRGSAKEVKDRSRVALADKLAEKRGIDRSVTPRKSNVGKDAAAIAAIALAHEIRLPIIGMSANNDTLSKDSAIEVRGCALARLEMLLSPPSMLTSRHATPLPPTPTPLPQAGMNLFIAKPFTIKVRLCGSAPEKGPYRHRVQAHSLSIPCIPPSLAHTAQLGAGEHSGDVPVAAESPRGTGGRDAPPGRPVSQQTAREW